MFISRLIYTDDEVKAEIQVLYGYTSMTALMCSRTHGWHSSTVGGAFGYIYTHQAIIVCGHLAKAVMPV